MFFNIKNESITENVFHAIKKHFKSAVLFYISLHEASRMDLNNVITQLYLLHLHAYVSFIENCFAQWTVAHQEARQYSLK